MFSLAHSFAPLLRLFLYSKLILDSQNHQDDLVSSQLPYRTFFKYISMNLCRSCANDLRAREFNSPFPLLTPVQDWSLPDAAQGEQQIFRLNEQNVHGSEPLWLYFCL